MVTIYLFPIMTPIHWDPVAPVASGRDQGGVHGHWSHDKGYAKHHSILVSLFPILAHFTQHGAYEN